MADKGSEEVKDFSGKLRYIDEATTQGAAANSVNSALEMRAILKPDPAVLYLMEDNRYFEIEIKNLKNVVTVDDEGWQLTGWLTSWLSKQSNPADKRLLQLVLEEEEDLFKGKGKKEKTIWLAAREGERDMWKNKLMEAKARVAAGWKPPVKDEKKEIHGHAHGPNDGHNHGHKKKQNKAPKKKDGELRFAVGTSVLCNTGVWSPAKIVAHYYREDHWEEGKVAPYQAELVEGGLIFCPVDDDRVVRLNDGSPPPEIEVEEEVDDADKTPVTVITGFLGAGKTTLVNYILTSKDHGMRIAIIENEFGAINIDEALVEDNLKTKEDLITMDNGCICCTVRGDLINALQQLAERRDQVDAVIIETTGLADPGPVCVSFKMPQLQRHFRVDGIVCLVDAKHIEGHLKEKRQAGTVNESAQQLGFADKILLNKVDLVTRKDVKRIKKTIRSVNSFADIIETQQSKVPLKRILGIDCFDVERSVDINPDMLQQQVEALKQEACDTDKSCCTEKGCSKEEEMLQKKKQLESGGGAIRKHDLSGVGSLGLFYEGVLSDDKFCAWLGSILQQEDFAMNLYRCKGVLCLDADTSCKWVFQGVHDNIVCKRSKKLWKKKEKKLNKIVFIGRNLDQDMLEKGFLSCKA